MKKDKETMLLPVATPVEETMIRSAGPSAPQHAFEAAAVSQVTLSSAAECHAMETGNHWNKERSYKIHTMQRDAHGKLVDMHVNTRSVQVKFCGTKLIKIFDANGTYVTRD
jgi:hypothetical protein